MQSIVIAGDIIVDHHLYEGERGAPTAADKYGVRERTQLGGAAIVRDLVQELLDQVTKEARQKHSDAEKAYRDTVAAGGDATKPEPTPIPESNYQAVLGVTAPDLAGPPCPHHAYAVWQQMEHGKSKVWRAGKVMGYGHDEADNAALHPPAHCNKYEPKPRDGVDPAKILVLDDAGFVFRHGLNRDAWLLPGRRKPQPDWIVLKMSAPVAQGDLWKALVPSFADRLICVVSAKNMRRECVALSESLSWERTAEELYDTVVKHPALRGLLRCRHLLITFGIDGLLWIDSTDRKNVRCQLVCDAGVAEGEWSREQAGEAFGYHSCLAAAIVHALVKYSETPKDKRPASPNLAAAGVQGLAGARDLRLLGHGIVTEKKVPDGFPVRRLAAALTTPSPTFSIIPIPWPVKSSGNRTWRIVEASQHAEGASTPPALSGLARQVVLSGLKVLTRLPYVKFGDLFTVDRAEIEALRNISRLMLEYKEEQANKPLSFGVFGPPGAGKSFGVREVSKQVFGKEAWLEFNLSQFSGPVDLCGAFHRVRDVVLGGVTPVVFWDEFDSKDYRWLQYLLAPMQDGRFQEGQLNHAVGKCVFIFAGATSHSYEQFGPPKDDKKAYRQYVLRKGPDFHSRLDAYYDVLGPNQRLLPAKPSRKPLPDPTDVCAPLRRAIMIRNKLVKDSDRLLDFDSDLLDALLEVPRYTHGARSLEKFIMSLKPADGVTIRRSSLPPPGQLAMHVNPDDFLKILGRNQSFHQAEVIEKMAPAIHATWQSAYRKPGQKKSEYDKPFEKLDPMTQEVNRAAASRMPGVLALAGLQLFKKQRRARRGRKNAAAVTSVADIRRHLEYHIERLAEAEHEGWMRFQLQNGWQYAKQRNNAKKLHHALVEYGALTEEDKEKDRSAVRHYPDMAELAGFRIGFPGDDG